MRDKTLARCRLGCGGLRVVVATVVGRWNETTTDSVLFLAFAHLLNLVLMIDGCLKITMVVLLPVVIEL